MATLLPLLGFTAGEGIVRLDLRKLVTSRLGVVATSGGGKSWTLRYLLEGTHGQIQQFVLDPEGEFASLREHFDYVLAGGEGDVPARPETAAPLCRRLLELNASAILDLSDLAVEARQDFVAAFVGELMTVPRALWRPLLVVVDEAHLFCPEKGEEDASSKPAVVALATQGRKRGFCAILASQRVSNVANNALAEMQNWLIGPTAYEPDVKRAGDALGFDRRRRDTLKTLEPGQFYARGPAISREVVLVRTGPVRTCHPEPGQIAPPAPPAPEKIRALLGQLADLPIEDEPAVPTPSGGGYEGRDLRRALAEQGQLLAEHEATIGRQYETIADLERRLVERLRPTHDLVERVAEVFVRVGTALERQESNIASLRAAKDAARAARDLLDEDGAVFEVAEQAPAPRPAEVAPVPSVRPERVKRRPAAAPPLAGDDGLAALDRKILRSLATLTFIGEPSPSRLAVALFAGYRVRGRYTQGVNDLERRGLVAFTGDDEITLTRQGAAAASASDEAPPSTLTELHEVLKAALRDLIQRRVFDVLLGLGAGGSITRTDLAAELGYKQRGRFTQALNYLVAIGLVDQGMSSQDGESVTLSPLVFPKGLT